MIALWLMWTCVSDEQRVACHTLGFEDGTVDGYDEGFVRGWIAGGGDPAAVGVEEQTEDTDAPEGGFGDPGSGQ